MNEIVVDGSLGEGGGQVFRTSLTLSLLTKIPFRIINIRANRRSPGLKNQHLTSLLAACQISNAAVEGGSLGSQEVFFSPGEITPGRYSFEIPTAGSTALVLQTIFLPLALASDPSRVMIRGGTHVPWSPVFHYLDWQWLNWMRKMGCDGSVLLNKCGYFPKGGGEITCEIRPAELIEPQNMIKRGKLIQISGISGVSNLDLDIAKRKRKRLVSRLGAKFPLNDIRTASFPSPGKGTFLVILVEFEDSTACFSALGRKGKRAEQVADEVAEQVESFVETPGCVDRFLSDQLLIPLSLAKGNSRIHTTKITSHLTTNAEIIQQFLPCQIKIDGIPSQPGLLTIIPNL
jgi:RNA 3'-terminal phosphate cyclase (ATP)